MEIIFKYDIVRLNAYSCNTMYDNQIKVINQNNITILQFPEVGYFNYSFSVTNEPIDEKQVSSIIEIYRSAGINNHKIIIHSDCPETKNCLCNQFGYTHAKTMVKTSFPIHAPVRNSDCENIELINVDDTNIYDFTCAYLNGFESTHIDYKKITENFKQLLNVGSIHLYLLIENGNSVGINVLYRHGEDYLLAGGAILKEYRNRHFHKHGMIQRIKHALKDPNLKGIYSSAYKGSISAHNMLSIGMGIAKTYDIYEYSR